MNRIHHLLSESRTGKKSLGEALAERDETGVFNRCMVGGEGCSKTAIRAHCIPETALELIMDGSREVIAGHSRPPKTPYQWLNEGPLKPMNIRRFNSGKWACQEHDARFRPLDMKSLETLEEGHLFLMVYKIAVYLTQRSLHAGERLVTPLLDPTTSQPMELSEGTHQYLEDMAQELTHSAVRTTDLKRKLDGMLNDGIYDKIEYRATMWRTEPTVAAVGMVFVDGPGDRQDWFGWNLHIPVWIALLPQQHGQTIITASPTEVDEYTRDIHNGVPRERIELTKRGNNWTRLILQKVLTNATDLAIGKEAYSKMSDHQQRKLQEFFLLRRAKDPHKLYRGIPNILKIR